MATSTLTELDIMNQALSLLGETPVIAADLLNTRRGILVNRHYITVRDATLQGHPWNFAMRRVTLDSFCEPVTTLQAGATTGTCVTFTVSCGLFTDADVGKTIEPDVTCTSHFTGKATITLVSCTVFAIGDITTPFSTLATIPCGQWRLYNKAPAFDYARSITYPTDALRVWRVEDRERYQVEEGFIVSDADSLNLRYIRQITNTTLWPPNFVMAVVYHLAASLSEAITGQAAKFDRFWAKYQDELKKARTWDGQEGTPEKIISRELIDVRYEGSTSLKPWWWR
jgi:hypothetical protein